MPNKVKTNKTDTLSDGDIERISNLLDNRLRPMDEKLSLTSTKQDLTEAKEELKEYIHQGIQSVMDGMDKLSEQLAEKERVDRLEQWTRQIAEKVGVKLS